MKKLAILFLSILLISAFALAAESEAPETDSPSDKVAEAKDEVSSTKLGDIGTGAKEKAEGFLEREIPLPDSLQSPVRFIFGIKKEETVSQGIFFVMIAIWFMLFMIIAETLRLTPIFHETWQYYVGGAIVTTIIAITRAINSIAIFLFNLGNMFEWMEKLGPFQIFIGLFIAGIIFFALDRVLKIFTRRMKLENAKSSGEQVGRAVATSKAINESVEESEED